MELGPEGIRANALRPASVEGPRIDRVIAADAAARGLSVAEVEAEYKRQSSLRTFATNDDIVGMVRFLTSPAGQRISGQALAIDGHTESLSLDTGHLGRPKRFWQDAMSLALFGRILRSIRHSSTEAIGRSRGYAMNFETFITCAVTGSATRWTSTLRCPSRRSRSPMPRSRPPRPGAAIAHIHVRDPATGKGSRYVALDPSSSASSSL